MQTCKDKSRRLLQTQELYDRVKRKAELGQIQRAASDAVDSSLLVAPHIQQHWESDLNTGTTFRLGGNRVNTVVLDPDIPVVGSRGAAEDRWLGGTRALNCTSALQIE